MASSPPGSPGRADVPDAPGIRDLARRYRISPSRALGQHFLIDPNLARAIVADAGVGPADRVVEIGAGLGSLTRALAATGAEILAIEFDRGLLPALEDVVRDLPRVRILAADATKLDWGATLGEAVWTACANLPYNVAVPLMERVLSDALGIRHMVVMVQKEVGERMVARPGQQGYGPFSLRVGYHASASILRSVPATVFWPRPKVGSLVVRIDRLDRPAVKTDPGRLWQVVGAGFAGRRKTIRAALRPLAPDPDHVLLAAGIDPSARAEALPLEAFARIAEALTS